MIPDIVPVNTWSGNSSSTTFDFDFLINKESELQVFHTSSIGAQTELKLNIDYTINQVGNENGSYINFPILGSSYNVLSNDEKITLALNIPIAQTSPYGTSTKLNMKALEYSLDYIVRLIQIISRKVDRSVKVQEGDTTTPDQLIESLNEAQIIAQNFAQIASSKADDAKSSAISANTSAVIAQQKTAEIQELYSDAVLGIQQQLNIAEDTIIADKAEAIESIDSAKSAMKTEAEAQINNIKSTGFYMQDGKLHYVDENGETKEFTSGTSLPLFTPVIQDHLLSFEESQGYALQGTYVYKTGIAGERYGYKEFVDKCIEEYNNSTETNQEITIISENIPQPTFTSNTTDGITISDSRNNTTTLQAIMNGSNESNQIGVWSSYWLNINYNRSTILNSYTIQADNTISAESPSAWTLEGSNDGSTFETIESKSGQSFTINQSRTYNVTTQNKTFKQYRLVFSAGLEATNGNGELKKVTFNASTPSSLPIKIHSNGHQFYDIADKSIIDAFYNTTGIAGFYGVDTENERIFLPRNDWYYRTNGQPGYIPPKLPDILANVRLAPNAGSFSDLATQYDGAFEIDNNTDTNTSTTGNAYTHGTHPGLNFRASKYNSIYDGTTVQPPSQGAYLYFVVGNTKELTTVSTTVPDSEVLSQLNQNTTDIANLEDEKLSRNDKAEITEWGVPDYSELKYLTLANTWYTAQSTVVVYMYGTNTHENTITISPDKTTLYQFRILGSATSFATLAPFLIPKGWYYKFSYATVESGYKSFVIPLIGGI